MRAVVDTNVLFEGLTKQGGACALIVEAWDKDDFQACVSNALAYEYSDVLARKLSPTRWQQAEPMLIRLLDKAEPIHHYFTWRPSSPDPGDEHIIDCAMTAGAAAVASNPRDFRQAQRSLSLVVMTPAQMVAALANEK